jgi:hypothetical protein
MVCEGVIDIMMRRSIFTIYWIKKKRFFKYKKKYEERMKNFYKKW